MVNKFESNSLKNINAIHVHVLFDKKTSDVHVGIVL